MSPSSAKSVQVSAVALLRMAKHAKSSAGVVSGCLVGLDTAEGQVEVTNVFMHPAKGAADFQPNEESASDAAGEFQAESLRLLKLGNSDSNIVGWFQSSSLSSFVNEATVEIQYDYQLQNSNSVLLVFDATTTSKIEAFQLSPEYMQFHKTIRDRRTQGPASLITGGPVGFNTGKDTVFVPVAVTAALSVLDEAFLFEQRALIGRGNRLSGNKSAADLEALTALSETIEDLAIEKVRYAQLSSGIVAGTTRIRGEDENKRLQSANDLILLNENAKRIAQHLTH